MTYKLSLLVVGHLVSLEFSYMHGAVTTVTLIVPTK